MEKSEHPDHSEHSAEVKKSHITNALLEDIFNNFYSHRSKIYLMNFVRGIFFGVGSVVGASVVVASTIALLSHFTNIPGGIGQFVQSIINEVNKR